MAEKAGGGAEALCPFVRAGPFLRVSPHLWAIKLDPANGPQKTRASCKLETRHAFYLGRIIEIIARTHHRLWHSPSVTISKSYVLFGADQARCSSSSFRFYCLQNCKCVQRKYLLSSHPTISSRASGVRY